MSFINGSVAQFQSGRPGLYPNDVGQVTGTGTPVGPAGGDLAGFYPNPTLVASGVVAGAYNFASVTVDAKGRVTAASTGVPVTSVASGTGLTGGPITSTGTLSVANTTVAAASYTLANITVNAQGQLTAAGNGSAVTSVASGTGLTGGPITTTGTLALANTTVTPGAYTNSSITVDQQGRITAASSGTSGVTNVASGTGLTGGPITNTGTLSIANTAVAAGSYTLANVTVNAQGQLTAAASGTAVTNIATGTGLSGGPITTTGTISMANSGVTAASYVNANMTVNAQGQLTAASNGAANFGDVYQNVAAVWNINTFCPFDTVRTVTGTLAWNAVNKWWTIGTTGLYLFIFGRTDTTSTGQTFVPRVNDSTNPFSITWPVGAATLFAACIQLNSGDTIGAYTLTATSSGINTGVSTYNQILQVG